jgi:hypothetical protein
LTTPALSFDKHQFGGRGQHPVHADFGGSGEIKSPGISFDDYSRMSTQLLGRLNSGRRLAAPSWAYNDDQLLRVLARSMEERALIWRHVQEGTDLERLARAQQQLEKLRPQLTARVDKLCKLFVAAKNDGLDNDARTTAIQVEALDTQIRLLPDMPKILTGVVYFFWRAGFNSVQTGYQLGIKPPHVRQILCRLLAAAKLLGFAPPEVIVRRQYKRVGGRRIAIYPRPAAVDVEAGPVHEVVRLHKEGKFTVDIARELKLGANGCEIVNLVLIQAGLR